MWAWDHMISLSALPKATEPLHPKTTAYTAKLAQEEPNVAELVKLRYFAGLPLHHY